MKKEIYRSHLPHFHTPGRKYFVTWCLKSAVPNLAIKKYSSDLENLKKRIELLEQRNAPSETIDSARKEYYILRKNYISFFNKMLDSQKEPKVNLGETTHTDIISTTLKYWEAIRITNIAFSIMPNHIHWVLQTFEKGQDNELVFLQDVLKSVKQYSAGKINRAANRSGRLWHRESFDVTIRNESHLSNVIRYTLNNPVNAGLVKHWSQWPGNWCKKEYLHCF
jgi:REP element-mobilizing transposase RayT